MGVTKRDRLGLVAISLLILVAFTAMSCKRTGNDSSRDRGSASQPASTPSLSGALEDGTRVIRMTARRFAFDPDLIVVTEGEAIRLEVTSTDVTHGIMIHEMDITRTLEPNKTETIAFTAGKPGTYHFHCSVMCGEGHGRMKGEMVVLQRK